MKQRSLIPSWVTATLLCFAWEGPLWPAEHPSCRPQPEAARALYEIVGAEDCQPGEPCWEERVKRLDELRERFPRDVHVHREYQDALRGREQDALLADYQALREQRPADPLVLYLYARLLQGEALREAAQAALVADPEYPWAHLARLASSLRQSPPDTENAYAHLKDFIRLCPETVGPAVVYAGRLGEPEDWLDRLPAWRHALHSGPLRDRLRYLRQLWALEFKLRPPTEHAVAREQVRSDLAQLEQLQAGGRSYLALLEHGYELVVDEDKLQLIHRRQTEAFACDSDVARREIDGWLEKRGGDEAMRDLSVDLAKELYDVSGDWVKRCPDSYPFWGVRWSALRKLPELPDSELLGEIDGYLQMWDSAKERIGTWTTPYAEVAEVLLERGLEPQRLTDLIAKERAYVEKERTDPQDVPASFRDRFAESNYLRDVELDLLAARSHVALEQTDAADGLLQNLEGRIERLQEMPEIGKTSAPRYRARLLAARAELAVASERKPDAVVLLRRAAAAWPAGESRDRYEQRARELWAELGGSDESYEAMAAIAQEAIVAEETLGRWEESDEPLAPFELVDLKGKTWTLDDLAGKTVLINLWATWCGPCRAEMPHLFTLQQELDERNDVQVVTFNLDRNPGLILPYLEKEGMYFDVLLAERYIQDLLGGFSIPQNWILDEAGVIRLRQSGFSSAAAEQWLEDTRGALFRVSGTSSDEP